MTDDDERVNTEVTIWKHAVKPCRMMAFCPYGPMVELFPLQEERGTMSCTVFGHDCPVFYTAEIFMEDDLATHEEREQWYSELNAGTKRMIKKNKKENKKSINV